MPIKVVNGTPILRHALDAGDGHKTHTARTPLINKPNLPRVTQEARISLPLAPQCFSPFRNGCRLLFQISVAYNPPMIGVRSKERQAECLAHMLDDGLHVPGTSVRMGLDPLFGLIPVVGDAVAAVGGAAILVMARQLHVPWRVVARMANNLFKNGLFGSVPFLGDAYSFYFKSNAVNAALLLRAVKQGEEGACALTTRPLTILDMIGLTALILPTFALVAFVSIWFWDHNISLLYIILFPHFYQRWEE